MNARLCLLISTLTPVVLFQLETMASAQEEAAAVIHDVFSTPGGIVADVTLSRAEIFSAGIDKEDPATGAFLFVATVELPLPSGLKGVRPPGARGKLLIPLVVDSNPDASYRLYVWVKHMQDPNVRWVRSSDHKFRGHRPTVADTIRLELGADSLTISAKTPEKAVLKAGWKFEAEEIELQATTEKYNPSLPLSLAALRGKENKGLPSLVLILEDTKTRQFQEARITLAVNANESVTQTMREVKKETDPKRKNDKRFRWGDLAATGIGAVLQYFAGII